MVVMIKTIVKANNYMDSIFLMKASREAMKIPGVKNAVVVMGTDMNKTVLDEFGGLTSVAKEATANDLIISLDIEDENLIQTVEKRLEELISQKTVYVADNEKQSQYSSLNLAAEAEPEANLAVISVPGEYAATEAKNALEHNMNVFIFSDNVPIEEEVELKNIAVEKGLLVMGPGCGTSVINNISLGLMSRVRRGCIGIVGASGSGIHEIAMLVHRYGEGISQAIGTGGRDLSSQVGGITMLQGIEYLANDSETKIIVLVSKPPHPKTMQKILQVVPSCGKPVIILFLGGDKEQIKAVGAYSPSTLEEAAEMAVQIARGEQVHEREFIAEYKTKLASLAEEEKKKLSAEQKYLRGLFCGGTHSEEAILLIEDFVPNLHSNIPFGNVAPLKNRHVSEENAIVDMGDEEFTKGKPHPVMDPSILCDRLMQESLDLETGVILFDLLFGHAVHSDPVGTIEDTLLLIRNKSKEQGRYISLIASLCGTDLDPQGINDQKRRLEELGVIILPSNAQAAILSGLIVS